MKCPFCHNEMKNVKPSTIIIKGNYGDCDCGNCTTYFLVKDNKIDSYGIHIEYKDKKYAALFHLGNQFTLRRWSEDDEGPGDKVFTLQFHPHITPQNFLRKLPTLLVFS
jgi:hypothetical protein